MTPSEIIAKGVEVCGSRTELATHLDVSTSSIDKWRKTGIPAKHCSVLYRLTGIPLYEMCPDVFDRDLTLSEAWEVEIVYLLRHAKLKLGYADNLIDDFKMILELETGYVDPYKENR